MKDLIILYTPTILMVLSTFLTFLRLAKSIKGVDITSPLEDFSRKIKTDVKANCNALIDSNQAVDYLRAEVKEKMDELQEKMDNYESEMGSLIEEQNKVLRELVEKNIELNEKLHKG